MKKSLFASLFLVGMCAIASGSHATRATAATSATPAQAAPQFGACHWVCDGPTAFKTATACQASCAHECEVLC